MDAAKHNQPTTTHDWRDTRTPAEQQAEENQRSLERQRETRRENQLPDSSFYDFASDENDTPGPGDPSQQSTSTNSQEFDNPLPDVIDGIICVNGVAYHATVNGSILSEV